MCSEIEVAQAAAKLMQNSGAVARFCALHEQGLTTEHIAEQLLLNDEKSVYFMDWMPER